LKINWPCQTMNNINDCLVMLICQYRNTIKWWSSTEAYLIFPLTLFFLTNNVKQTMICELKSWLDRKNLVCVWISNNRLWCMHERNFVLPLERIKIRTNWIKPNRLLKWLVENLWTLPIQWKHINDHGIHICRSPH